MFSDIKYLFFDLGSTLLDEAECDKAVINFSIAGNKISYYEFEAAMRYHASQNRPAYKIALRDFNLPKAQWDSSLECLYPGVADLLSYLTNKYRIAVVANQLPGVCERLLNFGILRYFDFIVSSAEFGVAKPAPEIFLEALRLADCKPNEAVMIGDRLDNDIFPAQQLGLRTIWVRQGFGGMGDPNLLPKYPDAIADSLIDLNSIL